MSIQLAPPACRNARLNAKIDSKAGTVVMQTQSLSAHEQVWGHWVWWGLWAVLGQQCRHKLTLGLWGSCRRSLCVTPLVSNTWSPYSPAAVAGEGAGAVAADVWPGQHRGGHDAGSVSSARSSPSRQRGKACRSRGGGVASCLFPRAGHLRRWALPVCCSVSRVSTHDCCERECLWRRTLVQQQS